LPRIPPDVQALNPPVYSLGGGHYLIDDTEIDWEGLLQQRQLVEPPTNMQGQSGNGAGSIDDSGPFGPGSYPEGSLWLEVLAVTNNVSMALHGALNGAWYEILSSIDLVSWTSEGTLIGSAAESTQAAVSIHNPTICFYRARACDSASGMPLDWQWHFLGQTGIDPNGDFDSDGISNYEEYFEVTDPNTISFNTLFVADHVKGDAVAGTIEVVAGSPAQMALLVDSTNFAAATWSPFTSSFVANLPSVDGRHKVWVGLRGLAADSQQTWDSTVITRDTTPPQIIITNPVFTTTSQPMIQLQGFSPEPLACLSYDITNASGLLTNLEGLVVHQHYNTNNHTLTTNFFQCFDIDLTNGDNTITLRATDLAGNATVTNFIFTVVIDTNPPSIGIVWPQDGANVCGNSFTVDGWLDDPTATVTLSLVDTNGDTQIFRAIIERDGRFWVESLPLFPGTNALTLAATDAWGNSASTNLLVVCSDLSLNMFDVSPDQLFQAATTLTGTVG
jgi:hypothetical protein